MTFGRSELHWIGNALAMHRPNVTGLLICSALKDWHWICNGSAIGWVGSGLAVYWLWIGLPVSLLYARNHLPLRLIVDPNRRLVPRLRAALVPRLTMDWHWICYRLEWCAPIHRRSSFAQYETCIERQRCQGCSLKASIGGLLMDWQICCGLALYWLIGNALVDWSRISIGMLDWWWIGKSMMNLSRICIGFLDWWWIDRFVMDWQIGTQLRLDWHLVGRGLSRSSLAETFRIVLVPSGIPALSVWIDPRLAWIGIGLAWCLSMHDWLLIGILADKYGYCIGLAVSVVSNSSSVETLRSVPIEGLFLG